VKDEGVRTKIFDWSVPMTVGGAQVAAIGILEWVPADSSGSSTGLIVALLAGAILLLAALAFMFMRRRRPQPAAAAGAQPGKPAERPRSKAVDEAW
jgi:LPXTG-motif cell wall-anchored protein